MKYAVDIRFIGYCCTISLAKAMLDDESLELGRTLLCNECGKPLIYNGAEWQLMTNDNRIDIKETEH